MFDDKSKIIATKYKKVRPNKSQIKRDIADIAQLTEALTRLTIAQLATIPLPQKITNAVIEAQTMSVTKSARKRQLKFITGQLRKIALDSIIEHLRLTNTQSPHSVRKHHQCEKWRDTLIASEDNDALTALLHQFPNADRQHIRHLQHNAQKEARLQNPTASNKAARILYQYLRELLIT